MPVLTKKTLGLFERWLDFLLTANNNSANKVVLIDFFLKEFTKNTKEFYRFLFYLENILTSKKQSHIATRDNLATKHINIISPLSDRFNFYEEKCKLDDICFKILEPKKYKKLSREVLRYKKNSKKIIKQGSNILNNLLLNKNYEFILRGRYKNIYSIYQKLQKKQKKKINSLSDVFAFRIILKNNNPQACYQILSLLHDNFNVLSKKFKDYINIPKINGYQSIHTSLKDLIPNLDLLIEVQIRSQKMHDFAEKGLAAHWLYKHQISHFEFQNKFFPAHRAEDMVYFFSFEGDLFKMEKGVKIIDFAYNIHTSIGNKAKSAIVNGNIKNIDYEIKEGDKVKILKSSFDRVKIKWLEYTSNKNTRKKIIYATKKYGNNLQATN